MNPTKTYAVLGNIDHDGERYTKGDTLDLTQAAADALIACGVLAKETPAQKEARAALAQEEAKEALAQKEAKAALAQKEAKAALEQEEAEKKKGKGAKK